MPQYPSDSNVTCASGVQRTSGGSIEGISFGNAVIIMPPNMRFEVAAEDSLASLAFLVRSLRLAGTSTWPLGAM